MNGMQGLAANQGAAAIRGAMMGRMSSGGIAGVASQAKGPSIKLVNDQDDYSKWEFYYDPTKDTSMGMAITGGMPQPGLMQGAAPGVNQNPNPGVTNQPANTPADNGTDNSVVVGGQQQQGPAGQAPTTGQPTRIGPGSPAQTNPNQ
jgi:hypothetical protein